MKKLFNFFGKVISWLLSFFFVMSAVAFLPHYSGIISLVITALLIPINKWQNVIKKAINGKLRIALVFALFVVMFLTVPVSSRTDQNTEDEPSAKETTAYTEPVELDADVPAWKKDIPAELAADIERAFIEIGENPDYIESIEYVSTVETAFFYSRDYKVTFDKGSIVDILDPETWVHSRFYRITTQEWFDSEPEKDIYPFEYLTSIKFWTDDDTTNINQWAQNGTGELQSADAVPLVSSNRDNIEVAYSISVSELVSEINKDKTAAGEKYNGQWIEITGTVTYISEGAGMTGYYLWGERGGSGLNITCWVDEADDTGLSVGDTVIFIGAMREVSTFNNTEIGLCIIK